MGASPPNEAPFTVTGKVDIRTKKAITHFRINPTSARSRQRRKHILPVRNDRSYTLRPNDAYLGFWSLSEMRFQGAVDGKQVQASSQRINWPAHLCRLRAFPVTSALLPRQLWESQELNLSSSRSTVAKLRGAFFSRDHPSDPVPPSFPSWKDGLPPCTCRIMMSSAGRPAFT